ncbi:hypothetical protein Tco_0961661 [Tanacetum coccineum]
MMTYLKHVGNYKHAELKIKKFEEVQALYEKIKRSDEDFISIGSAEDERLIKRMNEKGVDLSKSEVIKEESFDRVLWGDLMVLFNPDDKDEFWGSQQDWKISLNETLTMALELINFVKRYLQGLEPEVLDCWVWRGFSTHLASVVKELASPMIKQFM